MEGAGERRRLCLVIFLALPNVGLAEKIELEILVQSPKFYTISKHTNVCKFHINVTVKTYSVL